MDTAHTPGPWVVAHGNDFNSSLYVMAGSEEVCEVFDDSETSAMPEEANARLIAAAPDLLAVLRRIDEVMDFSGSEYSQFDGLQDQMVAAIAKAEGRS